jgi:site-specific recombinase XerD
MRIISEPNARTKSTRHRIIPLSDTARDALERHPKRGRIAPAIAPFSLSRAFARDLDRVGLDGNLHCLRHSYCPHLVAQGVHMAIVKEVAGHSAIKVTEKYTHADPAQKKQAVAHL